VGFNIILLYRYVATLLCGDMSAKKSMLDYCKKILQRVHFDARLFRKEYQKSIRWLEPAEAYQLK
jgi:hypothetical protein